jgi:hypothetical protein
MGKIIPVGDQKRLSEAITDCLKNHDKLAAKQPLAQKIFSIEKFYKKWQKTTS